MQYRHKEKDIEMSEEENELKSRKDVLRNQRDME